MDEGRTEFQFLGVIIGTYTGWDDIGIEGMQLYDFAPADGIDIPACSILTIDYASGIACSVDENGDTHNDRDMLTVLRNA